MLKKVSNLGSILNKIELKSINGLGPTIEGCTMGISIDGTACICLGWFPNGSGTCSPGTPQ
jgi:hypothetical protein